MDRHDPAPCRGGLAILACLLFFPATQACSQPKPSQLVLELPDSSPIAIEELEPGSAAPWIDSGTETGPADNAAVAPAVQSRLLAELQTADASRDQPRTPGIRYRLVQGYAASGNRALRLGVRTRAPAVRCELLDRSGWKPLSACWAYPPVWNRPGHDWQLDLPLAAGAEIGGFRLSPLTPDTGLSLVGARVVDFDARIDLSPEATVLPVGVRVLGKPAELLVEWPDSFPSPETGRMSWVELSYQGGMVPAGGKARFAVRLDGAQGKLAAWDARFRAGAQKLDWYVSRLGFRPLCLTLTAGKLPVKPLELRFLSAEAALAPEAIPRPLPADLWAMLNYRQASWRRPDLEVFSWNLFPDIVMIDFASTEVQARFLKRLIFFTEKKGYRGTLQPDSVIVPKHGWNANDFRAESLAAFFTKARQTGFGLNPEELELARMAVEWGLIKDDGTAYSALKGGLVTVARGKDMPDMLRSQLLQHECIHGIFFSSAGFRQSCQTAFDRLTPATRRFILDYFSFYQYDPSDSYLMVNEFGAYLLQQPQASVKAYITTNMVNYYTKVHPEEKEAFAARAAAAAEELGSAAASLGNELWRTSAVAPAQLACLIPR